MNKKGFTLVELLATIVVLSIVVSLTVVGVNFSIKNAKKKTEEVFFGTLTDAIKIYLDDDNSVTNLNWVDVDGTLSKTNGEVGLYKSSITFGDIIDSSYSPIVESDLLNPATDKLCTKNAKIDLYRDDDEVYYYYINKTELVDSQDRYSSCLLDSNKKYISNLPENAINSMG